MITVILQSTITAHVKAMGRGSKVTTETKARHEKKRPARHRGTDDVMSWGPWGMGDFDSGFRGFKNRRFSRLDLTFQLVGVHSLQYGAANHRELLSGTCVTRP